MSAPIGVGDWVECVDVTPHPRSKYGGPCGLRMGEVYRVVDIGPGLDPDLGPEIVVFVYPPYTEIGDFLYAGSSAWRFRPIYPGGELKRLLLEKPLEADPTSPAEPEKVPANA